MELEEFYKQVGGNFEDVKRRLLNEEYEISTSTEAVLGKACVISLENLY